MPFDIHGSLLTTEIGLIALSLVCLVADILIAPGEKKGKTINSIGMSGVALLFLNQCFSWGRFGPVLHGSLSMDGVSFFFKIIFLLAGFFVLFMAREYQGHLKRGHSEFTLLILFSLIGMTFLASASDFLLFFISLEIITVSLYIMTAYLRDENLSIEAGVKYLILGTLSTAVFLYGLSFIYGPAGSTSYAEIQKKLLLLGHLPISFRFGLVLVVSALGFKIAAVPFHLWVPDIYEGAPTPVTAYLAIGAKAAGFAALMRLMLTVFSPAREELTALFSVLSALTIIYGNLGAIPQTNLKRLLGYSSIGHAGYLLIGLAAFSHSGNEALLYYLLSYLFSTGGAFLVVIAVTKYSKTEEISELAGLSKKSPLLAAGMLLSLLSLAGIPPLAGFFAKFYLLWAGVKAGLLWLVLIGLLNVITSLYYYLKVVKWMYVDKPLSESLLPVGLGQKAMQYLSIFGILALGIYQKPFVKLAEMALSGFPK